MRLSVWFSWILFVVCVWFVSGVACDPPVSSEPTLEVPAVTEPTTDGGTAEKTSENPTDGSAEPAPDVPTPVDETPVENPPQPEPNPNFGKIRWSTSVGGQAIQSIALSKDEQTLFVTGSTFAALNPTTGDELWNTNRVQGDISSPVVGPKGKVYITTSQKTLWAIDPKTKGTDWSVTLKDETNGFPPALSKDGSVVYVISGNTLYAYKDRGTAAWSNNYVVTAGIAGEMSIDDKGIIYLCGKDGSLHAVNPDGTMKWEQVISKEPCRHPAIDADGTIYINGDRLYAVDPADGTLKWSYKDYGAINTPVVIDQIYLYFVTFGGKLYKANKSDGSPANIVWEGGILLSATGSQDFAPTIGAGGLIYIGTSGSAPALKILRPVDGKGILNLTSSRKDYTGTPAIAKDGTLYIGNSQGTVFAVWTNSPGLANSPWPRATRDNQNTAIFK